MRQRVWMCVVFVMVCVLAAPLWAATVSGRVTDATGAGIAGARVVLEGSGHRKRSDR